MNFAISHPMTVTNSGNSTVLYSLKRTDGTFPEGTSDPFSLSKSDFILKPNASETIKIAFSPFSTLSEQVCVYQMNANEIETLSKDPFAPYTIKITGDVVSESFPGHARNAIAYVDKKNGVLDYEFYWKHPTGNNQPYNNYFATEYQFHISSDEDFSSSTGYSYQIPTNPFNSPRYGTSEGYSNDFLSFSCFDKFGFRPEIDIDYYLKVYSKSNNNSGVAVYFSGSNLFPPRSTSQEIIDGYSGDAINLKIEKGPLDVFISPGNYKDFDLYQEVVNQGGGNNFILYTGINIYFSEGSRFESSSINSSSLKFNGILNNFSGDVNGTNINLFVPDNVSFVGKCGKGGRHLNQYGTLNNHSNFLYQTDLIYGNFPENGGNVFDFRISSNISNEILTNLNYNIFKKAGASIYAGGAGSLAAGQKITKTFVSEVQATDKNGKDVLIRIHNAASQRFVSLLNGSNFEEKNTEEVHFLTKIPGYSIAQIGYVMKNIYSGYGEDSPANADCLSIFNQFNKIYQAPSLGSPINDTVVQKNPSDGASLTFNAGKIAEKYSDSNILIHPFESVLPSSLLLRFPNSGIQSASSWVGNFNNFSSEFFILNSSTNAGDYVADYKGFGYKSIKFYNGKHLQGSSFPNITVGDFDIFLLVSYEKGSADSATRDFNIFNWYSTSSNISSSNIRDSFYNKLTNSDYTYPKENRQFDFKFSPLVNKKYSDLKQIFSGSNTKFGKDIHTETYYPFIINISRKGTDYQCFVNGVLISSLSCAPQDLIKNLQNTVLQIGNMNSSSNSTLRFFNFFDISFFGKSLSIAEKSNVYNFYLSEYFKLFAGLNENFYDISGVNRFRLPNILGVAGKS